MCICYVIEEWKFIRINHAAVFCTDLRRRTRWIGRLISTQSSLSITKATTNDWNVIVGMVLRIWRSWQSAAKHPDFPRTVRCTCFPYFPYCTSCIVSLSIGLCTKSASNFSNFYQLPTLPSIFRMPSSLHRLPLSLHVSPISHHTGMMMGFAMW